MEVFVIYFRNSLWICHPRVFFGGIQNRFLFQCLLAFSISFISLSLSYNNMYAMYASPVFVQPPSLDDYLEFRFWKEEQARLERKRQYQAYRQKCMERQRQRQRMAAALAALEHQQEEERRRKQHQQALNHRRWMAYMDHIRQQQEQKREQELIRQHLMERQLAEQQQLAKQRLVQQLYMQQDDDDDDNLDWNELVKGLVSKLLNDDQVDKQKEESMTDEKDQVATDDDMEEKQVEDIKDAEDSNDSDTDEYLMVLLDDNNDNNGDNNKDTDNVNKPDKEMDNVDKSDKEMDDTAVVDDDKLKLKLEALENIKQQLEDIHKSHQKVLASSLYFTDDDNSDTSNGVMIQVPTISKNHDFLFYEDSIMRILLQLDDISSDGNDIIRQQRKSLVKQAGMILDQLDQYKQAEWERHSSASVSSEDENEDNSGSNKSTGQQQQEDDDDDDSLIKVNLEQEQDVEKDDLEEKELDDDNSLANVDDKDVSGDAYYLMKDIDDDGFLILNL
ncbi:uncharacterized protein BX664DRAFT_130267 [Halteromyces radiatus]|uniref:uncharacterized protein n=1 Tax=Halteromyces radiatus TaxID=101107 RepID=UPI00221EF417|nr:uncharacterized protein BX664DRAFT_130267 [Halteromyces radiatus]KAI8089254.1 hypothetical protein BX664DRAFT_130267 [Halteromyces radiatus]